MAVDDSNTKSLLHFNGTDGSTTIVDESGKSWTVDSNTQLSTTSPKFGTASLSIGTGDIHVVDSDFAVGTGDFTIDMWVYPTSLASPSGYMIAFDLQRMGGGDGTRTSSIGFYIDTSGSLAFYANGGFGTFSAGTISANVWTHIVYTRISGVFKYFINGVLDANTTTLSINVTSGGAVLGRDSNADTHRFIGRIDEVRFSNVARWTSSFTPAAAEYMSGVSVSDSTSTAESISAEVTGTPPDLSLSTSSSAGTSESSSAFAYDPYVRTLATSDTVHVSDVINFIQTTPVPQVARVSGTINGNQISGYVRSLRRVAHLCNPGQHATLMLSPDWPHGVRPGRMVFLYEDGLQIMKGFVIRVVRSRPSYEWMVEIDDTYTLVVSTFLDQQEVTTAGHDTEYWASYILEKCGADFHINGTPAAVPAGVQIGLRPASEALKDIMAYASWYAWADKNGTIQLGRFDRSISGRTVTDFTKFEHDLSDDMTRNVIKVYGTGRIFAVSTSSLSIVPDRIAVVGSPLIGSNAEAQRVGDYMVGELGDLTKIIRGTIPGNPRIKVGNVVTLTGVIDGVTYSVTDTVSSLETNYDVNSEYTMEITVGERCPRIAGFSGKVPYTYAGLNGNGVYFSRDKGVNWTAMNSGLPTTAVASRVAGDSYGKCLAIINNSLWYETGTYWTPVTGITGTAKAVGALGGMDSFAVLTSGSVYFSIPSTGSTPPDDPTVSSGSISGWTPVAITTIDMTSGSTLYATGYDMYCKTGTAYVNAVTSSGSTSGSSSGSSGGGYGTGGFFGGTIQPTFFGQHIDTARVIGTGGTFYGETTVNGSGFGFTVDDTLPSDPGPGAWTLYSGAAQIAYHVVTNGSTYSNGSSAKLYMRGTLSATGAAGCDLTLYLNITTDYYGAGKGAASPSNVDTSTTVLCNPGETIDFEIRSPAYYLGYNGWLKDAYIGFNLSDRLQIPYPGYGNNGTYTINITQFRVEYADGGWSIFYPPTTGSSSGSYNLYTVNQAGAILVSDIPAAASTTDRLYVSDDGEVVLYNTAGRLLVSNNFGGTWHSAYPSSAPTKIPAVTRAQPQSTELLTSGSYNTVIGGITSGSNTAVQYQQAPETSAGWTAASNPPDTFVATDAIWSNLSTQGVLLGGGGYATKIFRYDPAEAPFGTPTVSDTGIPSAPASDVLDLEFGE